MIYVRFRDRDDPNTKAIRIAPAGGGVQITGRSWIVVRDLFIQGGQTGVSIKGPEADRNVVENCRLVNAAQRIYLEQASHTIVRNNDITADFYAERCLTGAWGEGLTGEAISDELALKNHFYVKYKHFFGPNSTSDYGIRMDGGSGNEIVGNRVSKGGQGIHLSRSSDVRVHGNTVEGMSSIGITPTMDRLVNVQIHDNLIMDCNIAMRIHHINELRQTEPRSLFVYRNRFWQRPGVGTGVFFHFHDKNDADPYLHPDIAIYHNTFAGGRNGIQLNAHVDRVGGLPDALVVNNVFSNPSPLNTSTRFRALENGWTYDHNWIGGGGSFDAVWFGPNNVDAKGVYLWDTEGEPNAELPAKSSASQDGLDISKSFTLGGKTYDALPGFAPGYFSGPAPDCGTIAP